MRPSLPVTPPRQPMLMTQFDFHIESTVAGIDIRLVRQADGSEVRFFLAGARSPEGVAGHMRSLTDDQCAAFYPDAKVRKDKKPAKAAQ